jgi:hypothetical protein
VIVADASRDYLQLEWFEMQQRMQFSGHFEWQVRFDEKKPHLETSDLSVSGGLIF